MGQGSSIAMSCYVSHRGGLDPTLLWLWCRLAAIASIRLLAWELPYDSGAALKRKKKDRDNIVKRQPTKWEKISTNYIFDMVLISRIFLKLPRLNNKKNPTLKSGQGLE